MTESLLQDLYKKKKLTNLSEQALREAVENLNSQDMKYRFFIGDLILHQDKKSIKLLSLGAVSKEPEIRRSSIYLLGKLLIKHREKEDLDIDKLMPVFYRSLGDEDPKVRKNTIIVLGAANEDSIPYLLDALEREKVDWIRPSIILSLGSVGNASVLNYLNGYNPRDEAETEALRKAVDHLTLNDKKSVFRQKLVKPANIELWTAKGLEDILLQKIKKRFSIEDIKASDGMIKMRLPESFNINDLFSIRCFSEILFPIGSYKIDDESTIAENAKTLFDQIDLYKLLSEFHENVPSTFRYRLELRYSGKRHIDRRQIINSLIDKISNDNHNLINSAGNYDVELRFMIAGDTVRVLLKPYTIIDTRFKYRIKDVPASINPAVASGILSKAEEYFRNDADVLDPFCGSSTMLIERARISPYGSLTGCDIAKRAIISSEENMKAAGLNIKLIHDDMRNINKSKKYAEVISNMPFGLRVGSHKENMRLYNDFIKLLPDIMEYNGYAVLFTQEIDLMMKALKSTAALTLISHYRIAAGGLNPGVFVLKNKKR